MRRAWWISVLILSAVAMTQAQDNTGETQRQGRRGAGRPARGGGPGQALSPKALAERLFPQLNLTPEQKTQCDTLVAKCQAQFEQNAGQENERRELRRQFAEAHRDGNKEREEELRQQLQALGGPGQPVRQFLSELQPLLDANQQAKLEEFRQTLRDQAPGTQAPGGGMRQLLQRLPEELNLTPEQRTQYDALVAEQRAAGAERMREMQALREQMRQAREQGDTAKAAELEQQIRGQAPGGEFMQKLEQLLTPEQKTKLAELRKTMGGPAARGGTQVTDVRAVVEAAKQLKLNDAQREKLKEIIRQAQSGATKARTPEAKAELAKTTKDQITALLDTTQSGDFERLLARQNRERPARDGRGASSQPAPDGPKSKPAAGQGTAAPQTTPVQP